MSWDLMSGPTGTPRLERTSGGVARSKAGAPWWAYERPPRSEPPGVTNPLPEVPEPNGPTDGNGHGSHGHTNGNGNGNGANGNGNGTGHRSTVPAPPPRAVGPAAPIKSGVPGMVVAGALILAVVIAARAGQDHVGVVLFPVAGVIAAVSFGHRCRRLRPDEPWLPRIILLGTLFKLVACATRYVTFAELYNQVGDAFIYDREARELIQYWNGERATDPMGDLALSGSGLIRWLTGVVYYLFGQDLLAAFFLFGLIALVGSYFWYRALVDAVPYADKRWFLLAMLFVPSIVFWPASLGKEALMQLALGAMAWATSLVLRGRFVGALPLALGGGFMLYMIRPHLLALATVAAAVPYALGHIKPRNGHTYTGRPVGIVILAVLVMFTVTVGSRFVGLENLSIDSVEEQLDQQTESTSYGGSTYSHSGNSLTNPLFLPNGVVTVLFRPFLWEAGGLLPALAATESAILLVLVIKRWSSIRLAFRRCRLEPFVLYCLMLLFFYSAAFSSLANFGLLTRQRSLVLPAIYALLVLQPSLAPRGKEPIPGFARTPEPEPSIPSLPPRAPQPPETAFVRKGGRAPLRQ